MRFNLSLSMGVDGRSFARSWEPPQNVCVQSDQLTVSSLTHRQEEVTTHRCDHNYMDDPGVLPADKAEPQVGRANMECIHCMHLRRNLEV